MLRHRVLTICVGYGLLVATIAVLWPIMRREFFPEVDAGAFEMYVRAHSGLRIEETEKRIKEVEDFVRKKIEPEDLQLVLSEIGVTSDWSAAYTPERRPDGRRGQDPAFTPSGRSRRRSTFISCARLSRTSRDSATWSSPSMPAAWSARR